jgi:hypothetical protein
MAVTAHYCARAPDGRLVLKSQLVAFRHVQGSHSGVNLARTFVSVVKEIGCLHRVSFRAHWLLLFSHYSHKNSRLAWLLWTTLRLVTL